MIGTINQLLDTLGCDPEDLFEDCVGTKKQRIHVVSIEGWDKQIHIKRDRFGNVVRVTY